MHAKLFLIQWSERHSHAVFLWFTVLTFIIMIIIQRKMGFWDCCKEILFSIGIINDLFPYFPLCWISVSFKFVLKYLSWYCQSHNYHIFKTWKASFSTFYSFRIIKQFLNLIFHVNFRASMSNFMQDTIQSLIGTKF